MFINVWKDKKGQVITSDDGEVKLTLDDAKQDIYMNIIYGTGEYVGTLSNGPIDKDDMQEFYEDMCDTIDLCRQLDLNPKDYTWCSVRTAIDDVEDDFTYVRDEVRGEIYPIRKASSFQMY